MWRRIAKRQYLSNCGTFVLLRRNVNGGDHYWEVLKKKDLLNQIPVTILTAPSADQAKFAFSKVT